MFLHCNHSFLHIFFVVFDHGFDVVIYGHETSRVELLHRYFELVETWVVEEMWSLLFGC